MIDLFYECDLTISPGEGWIGYPSEQVLSLHVAAFSITSAAERVAVTTALEFPR